VNFAQFIFPREAAALRPSLACEVTPAGVVAARRGASDQEMLSAYVPLRPGVFSAGLKTPNFSDRSAVTSAIRQAIDEVSERDAKITLVIPDTAVRVLLLDFDSLPAKSAEILPIIRFRLRKLVPFEIEDASVSYQVMGSKDGLVRTIVAVVPGPVLAEYESAVREAGYEPGVVLPSTMAALAAVASDEPSLVVNRNFHSVTTAITQRNELLLYRTLEWTEPGDDGRPRREVDGALFEEKSAEEKEKSAIEELQQSVSVAVAYYEDTLAATPRQLLSCGLGGADELQHLLGNSAIPAYDLAPVSGNTAMPRGVLAGVRGALAS
jgi:type IV pilus assembly protein PilM